MPLLQSYTVKLLYENPPGFGSANVAARYRIKDSLQMSFLKLLKKHTFKHTIITDRDGNRKFYVIYVPSESLKKVFYFPVVIQTSADANSYVSFMNSLVKVISLNPAFTFNGYAYVARKEKFLLEELSDKLNENAFQKPRLRNPQGIMGFDKSLWFAVSFIIRFELFKEVEGLAYSQAILSKAVANFDDIFEDYGIQQKKEQLEEALKKKQGKKDKPKEDALEQQLKYKVRSGKQTISPIKTVRTRVTVKTIRTSPTRATRKTKRIGR